MIEIVRYTSDFEEDWNKFLAHSKIDTFLFNRSFMDYHSDRFIDKSFLFFRKGKLEAILPGNINGQIYYSHQGLTYGGIVPSYKLTTNDILSIFDIFLKTITKDGLKELIYKPTPHIYHKYPSEEDVYALFKHKATKIGSNLSSTIYRKNKMPFIESRKSGIRKAKREGVEILEDIGFHSFWDVLEQNLTAKHGRKPVHSEQEIQKLKNNFNQNIKLYTAVHNNMVLGGVLLFIMNQVCHVQYISANEDGKNLGVIDLLFDYLINSKYQDIDCFDFGQSTENLGLFLNESLIFQKEGFGARGIVYDIYRIEL